MTDTARTDIELHPMTELARARLDADGAAVDRDTALTVFWMNRLARRYTAWLQTVLREQDVDDSETAILVALRLAGPPYVLTPRWLREMLMVTSGGVTRAVDRLVERGYVERRPDPDDGRGRIVALTDQGLERAGELMALVTAAQDERQGPATAQDRAHLLACIDTLLALYEDLATPP